MRTLLVVKGDLIADYAQRVHLARRNDADARNAPSAFGSCAPPSRSAVGNAADSTSKSRTVVKGLRTKNRVWRSSASSCGCGAARCTQTHRPLPHPVLSGSSGVPAPARASRRDLRMHVTVRRKFPLDISDRISPETRASDITKKAPAPEDALI